VFPTAQRIVEKGVEPNIYKHEGINLINTTLKVKCPKLQMPIRFSDLKQQTLATSYDKYFKTSLVFLRKDAKGVNSMREAFKDYA
jgi:hypothetical protein